MIECDNKFTANGIYELTDGIEFMVLVDSSPHVQRTGSILDLRFIPDDMVFDPSSIKEKATFVPENYIPSVSNCNDVTSHTNVQLSWDGEDQRRTNELVKGRSTKKNEKGEIDYSNYLASSDSSEEEEVRGDRWVFRRRMSERSTRRCCRRRRRVSRREAARRRETPISRSFRVSRRR